MRRFAIIVPGSNLFNGSTEYNLTQSAYHTQFETGLFPERVFQPRSADQVASFIKNINPQASLEHQLAEENVKFAIRGGGHTPWVGAANIDRGVTIDLRYLNGVDIDTTAEFAKIGAGETWLSVYQALEGHGFGVAGGRTSRVGVSGLITGGGLSFFSGERGFVCGDVVNFEVVLSTGEIVNANADEYRDLWVVLKGGSNNFGIVTRCDLAIFAQTDIYGGVLFFEGLTTGPELLRRTARFAADPGRDPRAHIITAITYFGGQQFGIAQVYHSKPEESTPASLKPFVELQPALQSTLRNDTLVSFAIEQDATGPPDGGRHHFYVTGYRPDEDFILEVRRLHQEKLLKIGEIPGLAFSIVFQPLAQSLLDRSAERGPNSLGLAPEQGPMLVNLIDVAHANKADDERVERESLDFVRQIDELAKKKGLDRPYRFLNYGYKTQKVLEGYGEESLMQMKAVSRKYDPTQFFQNRVPGGFKLKNVDLVKSHSKSK